MNIYPATSPRTWLIAAGVVACIAAANIGLAPLWNAEAAMVIGRWEGRRWQVASSSCSCSARWPDKLEESWTSSNAIFLGLMNRLDQRQWLGVAGLAWLVGWTIFHVSGDPDWVSSGIDWHDSHLDAYSLLYGDPPCTVPGVTLCTLTWRQPSPTGPGGISASARRSSAESRPSPPPCRSTLSGVPCSGVPQP